MNKTIHAGCAVRRQIRRWFMEQGIDFIEDKGLIDSVFLLKCSDDIFLKVVKRLKEWEEGISSERTY